MYKKQSQLRYQGYELPEDEQRELTKLQKSISDAVARVKAELPTRQTDGTTPSDLEHFRSYTDAELLEFIDQALQGP